MKKISAYIIAAMLIVGIAFNAFALEKIEDIAKLNGKKIRKSYSNGLLVDAKIEVSMNPNDKIAVYKAKLVDFTKFDFSDIINSGLKNKTKEELFEEDNPNRFALNYNFKNGESFISRNDGSMILSGDISGAFSQTHLNYDGDLHSGIYNENEDVLPFGTKEEALKKSLEKISFLKLPLQAKPKYSFGISQEWAEASLRDFDKDTGTLKKSTGLLKHIKGEQGMFCFGFDFQYDGIPTIEITQELLSNGKYIYSGDFRIIYAKNGIKRIDAVGTYEPTEKIKEYREIITPQEVIQKFYASTKFKPLVETNRVYKIALIYVPVPLDDIRKDFVLTPVWDVRFTDKETKIEDFVYPRTDDGPIYHYFFDVETGERIA